VIPAGASDTAALDAVFETLVRSGKEAPTAKLMLIPEAWQSNPNIPATHRAMYEYMASVMEPWDGPAALADDRRALGRRRCRPQCLASAAL
jgi:glutamate synthase (NADPH/NADH) large chain